MLSFINLRLYHLKVSIKFEYRYQIEAYFIRYNFYSRTKGNANTHIILVLQNTKTTTN